MTDIVITTPLHHKIRVRAIGIDNSSVDIAGKSATFYVGAFSSNEDGTRITPTATVEVSVPLTVPAMLADPELAADAVVVLQALERMGVVICQRVQDELAAKLLPPEPVEQPEEEYVMEEEQ